MDIKLIMGMLKMAISKAGTLNLSLRLFPRKKLLELKVRRLKKLLFKIFKHMIAKDFFLWYTVI